MAFLPQFLPGKEGAGLREDSLESWHMITYDQVPPASKVYSHDAYASLHCAAALGCRCCSLACDQPASHAQQGRLQLLRRAWAGESFRCMLSCSPVCLNTQPLTVADADVGDNCVRGGVPGLQHRRHVRHRGAGCCHPHGMFLEPQSLG